MCTFLFLIYQSIDKKTTAYLLYFRTHFPWSLDEQCNFYSIQFGRNLPIVGLVSYPSSGNTWLRYLLEGASGYFTGSMYNDVSIVNKGKIVFFIMAAKLLAFFSRILWGRCSLRFWHDAGR